MPLRQKMRGSWRKLGEVSLTHSKGKLGESILVCPASSEASAKSLESWSYFRIPGVFNHWWGAANKEYGLGEDMVVDSERSS